MCRPGTPIDRQCCLSFPSSYFARLSRLPLFFAPSPPSSCHIPSPPGAIPSMSEPNTGEPCSKPPAALSDISGFDVDDLLLGALASANIQSSTVEEEPPVDTAPKEAAPPVTLEDAIRQSAKEHSQAHDALPTMADLHMDDMFASFSDTIGSSMTNFLEAMMVQIVSREVLYEPILMLENNYPIWLAANRHTLSPEEQSVCDQHIVILRKILLTYNPAFQATLAPGESPDACPKPDPDIPASCGDPEAPLTSVQKTKLLQYIQDIQAVGAIPVGFLNEVMSDSDRAEIGAIFAGASGPTPAALEELLAAEGPGGNPGARGPAAKSTASEGPGPDGAALLDPLLGDINKLQSLLEDLSKDAGPEQPGGPNDCAVM
ncbi:hypothetical protein H696_01148 [Fonticula alba]|uniref:Uncharacterized protein n=1 Tax=Fonticula alba TaxID=691883 RepID=A0A058ZE40_FONAL|nr:hypothetical protein H696_01148 [Fonticula alba]KCV71727.1 hypothetical protein H696_01148 [Fonticula alba]|eukprot:XP_009493305.1 hypothetical protein H696_01148 [Fonticula alba]